MSCGIGHRRGSDSKLLWLQLQFQTLAWELPFAAGVTLKSRKKKKKSKHLALKPSAPSSVDGRPVFFPELTLRPPL